LAGVDLGGSRACTACCRRRKKRGEEQMDAVAIGLALAVFALMFGLIRAMDRI
jgi:hypothetical protein